MSHSPNSPPPPPDPNPNPNQLTGYAIELYFDPALENQVLKAWNVLARRQISSRLIKISARPHITLLSSPSLDPTKLLPSLRSLASRSDPLPLTLSSVSASSSSALFLGPTPTAALLGLHAQLCELLRKEGVEIGEEYRVDSWVPQCPVAEDVPRARMAEAFCILRDLKLPVTGYAVDIGVVEFSPVQEIFSLPLGCGNEAA